MTERLSDAQIANILDGQIDGKISEMGTSIDGVPMVDGSMPTDNDTAADGRFLWGFQSALKMVLGRSGPELDLPSGRKVRFEVIESSEQPPSLERRQNG